MKALRILIADDHALIRQGLRTMLEAQPGWTICGEAEDGRQAVKLSAELAPDVIVLDVSMPGLNGLDAIRPIREAAPEAEVLLLTMHESERLASDAQVPRTTVHEYFEILRAIGHERRHRGSNNRLGLGGSHRQSGIQNR